MAFGMSRVLSHLEVIELLFVRVRIQDCLKPFGVVVRSSSSLLVELYVAFDLRLGSFLIILFIEVRFCLFQVLFGDIPRLFDLSSVEKPNRGGISSIDD